MLKKFKRILKDIFHLHKWKLGSRSYLTNEQGEACDVWYDFVCQKCGAVKTVKTVGVDVFLTEYDRLKSQSQRSKDSK